MTRRNKVQQPVGQLAQQAVSQLPENKKGNRLLAYWAASSCTNTMALACSYSPEFVATRMLRCYLL
jgi:hypothetical protein